MLGVRSMMSMSGLRSSEPQRHEHARHDREVERHVELVALAEIRAHVLGPHVGLGQQHLAGEVRVDDPRSSLSTACVSGRFLAGGALALDEIGDRRRLGNPSTPRSSQNFITFQISSRTAGLS